MYRVTMEQAITAKHIHATETANFKVALEQQAFLNDMVRLPNWIEVQTEGFGWVRVYNTMRNKVTKAA